MPRSHTLPRAVAAALAITALAAPAAFARPIDNVQSADVTAHKHTIQDLRSPDAKDAATTPRKDPVYWAYDHPAPAPNTAGTLAAAQPSAPTGTTDDGAPWAIFALGVAGAALVGAGGASIAGKTRVRARRAGVTA